jgi:hypothetical protein
MLERYEWAPVLFAVGLGLVSIGLLGVGSAQITNVTAVIRGSISLGTGLSWWQGLKRP